MIQHWDAATFIFMQDQTRFSMAAGNEAQHTKPGSCAALHFRLFVFLPFTKSGLIGYYTLGSSKPFLCVLAKKLCARSSPTIFSAFGSHLIVRPSRAAIAQRWQAFIVCT